MSDTPIFLVTEQGHQAAFEKYWKDRGVKVKTNIEAVPMGDFTIFNLRSDLVMRVPRRKHQLVYGVSPKEIKLNTSRKLK